MLAVKKEGILLQKTQLGFECEGVLNPAVISYNNSIHIFYRAVAKGNYSSIGYWKKFLLIESHNLIKSLFLLNINLKFFQLARLLIDYIQNGFSIIKH